MSLGQRCLLAFVIVAIDFVTFFIPLGSLAIALALILQPKACEAFWENVK